MPLETGTVLANTAVRFKYSQCHSLPLYGAFQLDFFFFKPSAPKYSTKYLRLNLAPKKKTLAHDINNIRALLMISICFSSHISKQPLAPNVYASCFIRLFDYLWIS